MLHRDAEVSNGSHAAPAAPAPEAAPPPPEWPGPAPPRDIDVTDSDDEDTAGAAAPSDDGFSDIGHPGDTEVRLQLSYTAVPLRL